MSDDLDRLIAHTPPELRAKLRLLARQMRHEPTPAEDHLWQHLRNRRLKRARIRRQHPIYIFIVDFYCPHAHLVIEVDGAIHDYTAEQDAVRQEFLEAMGLRVIRFTNDAVLSHTSHVLEQIAAFL